MVGSVVAIIGLIAATAGVQLDKNRWIGIFFALVIWCVLRYTRGKPIPW